MKRASRATLLLMGTVSLALSACDDDSADAGVFSSVEECISSGIYTEQYCKTSLEQAIALHKDQAPRYKSKEDCEADFGPGQCQWGKSTTSNGESNSTNSTNSNSTKSESSESSVFMPMMMGFMVGQLLSNNRPYSEPLYRPNVNRGSSYSGFSGYNPGSFRTSRNVEIAPQTGLTKVRPSVLDSAAKTSRSAPTLSRGGFGASASAIGTGTSS